MSLRASVLALCACFAAQNAHAAPCSGPAVLAHNSSLTGLSPGQVTLAFATSGAPADVELIEGSAADDAVLVELLLPPGSNSLEWSISASVVGQTVTVAASHVAGTPAPGSEVASDARRLLDLSVFRTAFTLFSAAISHFPLLASAQSPPRSQSIRQAGCVPLVRISLPAARAADYTVGTVAVHTQHSFSCNFNTGPVCVGVTTGVGPLTTGAAATTTGAVVTPPAGCAGATTTGGGAPPEPNTGLNGHWLWTDQVVLGGTNLSLVDSDYCPRTSCNPPPAGWPAGSPCINYQSGPCVLCTTQGLRKWELAGSPTVGTFKRVRNVQTSSDFSAWGDWTVAGDILTAPFDTGVVLTTTRNYDFSCAHPKDDR
jgi:hypothetical protein